MTTDELKREKIGLLHGYYMNVIAQLSGYSPYSEGDIKTVMGILTDKYLDKITVRELGSSTTLLELEDLDIERLFIGTNEKFTRFGSFMYFGIRGSNPPELAVERVNERVKRIHPDLEIICYDGDYDNGEDDYYVLEGLGVEFEEGSWCFLPTTVPEGMSMLNRKKEHYAWGRLGFYSHLGVSLDKDLFDLIAGFDRVGTKKCIGCGTPMLSGENLCPLCRHKYYRCDECNTIHKIEDGVWSSGRFFCKECHEKPRCRVCQYPLSKGESVLCERCSKLHGILEYHTGLGRKDESQGSRLKIGYEVEKECADTKGTLNLPRLMAETGWVAEKDSSLNHEGFELISPILPLDMRKIPKLLEPLRDLLRVNYTRNCGGHIHVSDTKRTPYQILLDIRGYLPLLYGLYPDRATNEYCEAKEKDCYINSGHRQAVNVGSNTLEFRIFPAVKNIEQLIWRTSLVAYMLLNPETDVVKVGEQLLDESSELYNILIKRISASNIKKKAQAFIDFTNYLERDALIIEGKKIRRVIEIPKIKEDKERLFEERALKMSRDLRASGGSTNAPEILPIRVSEYGYFANLIKEE